MVSRNDPTLLRLLPDVYSCSRGPFWRKCSLNYCAVSYFSEIWWFREHFEATMHETRTLPLRYTRQNHRSTY
jgi:hypothetical protein